MKNKILEGLKSKYPDVSTSILSRIADKLAKTVTKEEDVETAVEGVSIQSLIEAETDRRTNDVVHTAVANYEKKHGLKDGKPVSGGGQEEHEPDKTKSSGTTGTEGGTQPQGADLAAQIAAAVKAAVEPLTQQIATFKAEKSADTFKQQLDNAISEASDKYKERVLRDSRFLKFDTPEAQIEWLEAIKAEASEDAANNKAQGAVFGTPKSGGKSTKTDEIPASVMAGIKQGAAPAADAQPF